MRWFPWERARAVRLLNKLTAEDFARRSDTEKALATGGFVAPPPNIAIPPALARDFTYNVVRQNIFKNPLDECLAAETNRRATRLILALEAWKLQYGRLPESLDDLRGKYLDQLPVDPYTGDAFRYEPKGLPHKVAWRSPNSADTKTLEHGQPFISCDSWSTPPRSLGSEADPTETELCADVWVFPIP